MNNGLTYSSLFNIETSPQMQVKSIFNTDLSLKNYRLIYKKSENGFDIITPLQNGTDKMFIPVEKPQKLIFALYLLSTEDIETVEIPGLRKAFYYSNHSENNLTGNPFPMINLVSNNILFEFDPNQTVTDAIFEVDDYYEPNSNNPLFKETISTDSDTYKNYDLDISGISDGKLYTLTKTVNQGTPVETIIYKNSRFTYGKFFGIIEMFLEKPNGNGNSIFNGDETIKSPVFSLDFTI